MREGLEVGAGVVVVFSVGWAYGAITGFAWRGLYDAWFRAAVNSWKAKGGLR